MTPKFFAVTVAVCCSVASLATAGGHSDPAAAAMKARQAQMQLYSYNLGPLVGMARGNADYDAAAAQSAADNLAALAAIDQSRYWLPGTDSDTLEGSRALPAIWENPEGVMAEGAAFAEAVIALQAAAGGGLESLQGAMGAVGGACGSCHESYRVPNN